MAPVAKNTTAPSQPSWSKIAAYNPAGDKKKQSTSAQDGDNPAAFSKPMHHVPQVLAPPKREAKPSARLDAGNVDTSAAHVIEESKTVPDIVAKPGTLRREESSKAVSNDDGSTQLSSDESGKPPSFDTKSIASGTTFALDEKESLRPDDSASMRAAIEEEDMFSVAGSRVGSDLGKPFREQLQDIPYIESIPPKGALGTLYQSSSLATPVSMADPLHAIAAPILPLSNVVLDGQIGAVDIAFPPDEKLMDALQSQRDRVWVLKLEQDIIDFVGQSKEATLTLPQCNAFYRMLAHKLADYYRLDHTVAQTATGSAVVISRTSFARIPPPLSGLPISSTVADTPPLIPTARKIMRRPGDSRSENTTAANSEGPSASVSEVGVDGDPSKPKSQLTREEREKQYAEVRERIFGKSDLIEGNETSVAPEEADQSRSSSANGKKKSLKKQRNLSNDDFEPRSQFPAYFPPNFPVTGFQGEQYYYPQYPPVAPNPSFQPNSSGPSAAPYQPPFTGIGPDGQSYPWSGPQPQLQHTNGMIPSYPQGSPTGYDISTHFQNSMQFQNAPNGGSMPNKGHASPMNTYLPPVMNMSPQVMMNPWQQPASPTPAFNGAVYGTPGFQNQGIPSGPGGQYRRSQMPPSFSEESLQQMQAIYHRQQFNPQTQAFVPSGPGQRFMSMPTGPASYQQFGYPSQPPQQFMRSNQPPNVQSGLPVSFGSPGQSQAHAAHFNNKSTASYEPQQQQLMTSNEPSSPDDYNNGEKPVLEITAKFGMPSHLPPRPPPPQTMEPHKFHEINRGVGGLHAYPGMPRIPSNSFNGNGGNVGGRNASSQA